MSKIIDLVGWNDAIGAINKIASIPQETIHWRRHGDRGYFLRDKRGGITVPISRQMHRGEYARTINVDLVTHIGPDSIRLTDGQIQWRLKYGKRH